MTNPTGLSTAEPQQISLVRKMATRFHVDSDKLMGTLKATAFKQRAQKDSQGKWYTPEPTNEQMMALMVVADQYQLNPFTKEIYAFPDKQNGIVPIVGVDGWNRIINENPNSDGIEFEYSEQFVEYAGAKPCPAWCDCIIYRADRKRPIKAREYLDEVYRPAFVKNKGRQDEYTVEGPWQTHTKRMLRHKALIQTARIAFGYSGIYDPDEGQQIIDAEMKDITPETPADVARNAPRGEPDKSPELLPVMDKEFFDSELKTAWTPIITSGKKSAQQIIDMLGTRYSLSEEQEFQIYAIEDVNDDDMLEMQD